MPDVDTPSIPLPEIRARVEDLRAVVCGDFSKVIAAHEFGCKVGEKPMAEEKMPTKRMVEFLRWMRTEQPVGSFPAHFTLIWHRANKQALIEPLGRTDNQPFAPLFFALSTKGRQALEDADG